MSVADLPMVRVLVRYSGGAFVARAGRGKKSKSASSTDCATVAAQRAAAKYFGLDESNITTPGEITLSLLVDGTNSGALFTATLPAQKGGAS